MGKSMASSTPTPPAPAPQPPLDPAPPGPIGADAGDSGRPPGSGAAPEPEATPPELELPAGLLTAVVRIPFRRWRQPLEDYEAEALAEALAAVVNKYLPSGSGRYGEEIQLGLVLVMILQPRLQRHGTADDGSAGEAEPDRPTGGPQGERKDVQGKVVGGIRPAGIDH